MTEDLQTRFGGIERLYSKDGLQRLLAASVCVVGVGGVGSWAAEALARSGIGRITLVDLDDVCVSNVNRQLHALDSSAGRPKVEVMAERIRAIHPCCDVHPVCEFFNEATADKILKGRFDWVIDAIDQVGNKCRLIAACHQRQIPIISAGGAGGRRDPSRVRIADLAEVTHDNLMRRTRKTLREDFGFPTGPKRAMGVPCVYSSEPPIVPECGAGRITCDTGYGTAAFVTGTFGFVAAAHVVSAISYGVSPA